MVPSFILLAGFVKHSHSSSPKSFNINTSITAPVSGLCPISLAGKRIVAVGTTSTRVLETVADSNGHFKMQSGNTKIFIYPGYKFHGIDALLTNFHLPKSTLIMLISALAGKENVLNAYKHAVKEKYRFFSFGDCMFIK